MELSWILSDDISLTYWLMIYIISLVRENQGYTVICSYPLEKEINSQKFDYLHEHFPNITLDNLRLIHQLIFNLFCGWDSDSEKNLVTQEAKAFSQQLLLEIPVSINEKTKYYMTFMLNSLYLSKKYRPIKTSTLFDRIYYFSLSLKRANDLLYNSVEVNLKHFSHKVNLDISSNVADVLFWLCLVCPELSQFLPPKKALFITDFGMPHTKFLAKSLSDFFSTKTFNSFQIDIARSTQTLTLEDAENYDIIITTISDLPVHNNNIFLINDYPSYEDFMGIYQNLYN